MTFQDSPTIIIGGIPIYPGEQKRISLPVAMLYTHTPVEMPVHVIHGKKAGPKLFVCAALHGDELNGIEIIRRLLRAPLTRRLKGTLICVPIVNVYGVLEHSRYLPDRRDLNRSFPGTERGSLAARLADLFMTEVVAKCSYGIDLHTGALHRTNLPHIRAKLDDPKTAELARAFGVPVLLNSDFRDGSLRQAAADSGVTMLLYEAGEALRFDEISIRAGVSGILNVLRRLGMLPAVKKAKKPLAEPVIARSSLWIRAPQGGILRARVLLGQRIEKNTLLGVIADPFGDQEMPVTSLCSGIIIGRSSLPLVNEGDALFHLARFAKPDQAAAVVEAFASAENHAKALS